MIKIASAPVDKLLGYAMRAEIESDLVYTEMSNRVKNPLLVQKFRILAYEEQKHKSVLENLFQSMFPGGTPEVPEKVEAGLLPAVTIGPASDLTDILHQAMAAERSAQAFYAALAKRVAAGQKKFLEYLSKVERSHFLMLRSEYAIAQEFEDYGEKGIDKIST